MSVIHSPPVPPVITGTAVNKDDSRDFMAVFPDVVRDLTDTGHNLDVPDVTKWLGKVCALMMLFRSYTFKFNVLICYRCCSIMCPVVRKTEDWPRYCHSRCCRRQPIGLMKILDCHIFWAGVLKL